MTDCSTGDQLKPIVKNLAKKFVIIMILQMSFSYL